jgi:hypothetical protein
MPTNDTDSELNIEHEELYISKLQSSLDKHIKLIIEENKHKDQQIIDLTEQIEKLTRDSVADKMRTDAARSIGVKILYFMLSTIAALICIGILAYNC